MFACLGKIDLADYLHSDRSSIVGGSNFLKFFHDTSTLELSQRPDHSHVESTRACARDVKLCLLSLTRGRPEQRFGVSYVAPEVDEGWRDQQSASPESLSPGGK